LRAHEIIRAERDFDRLDIRFIVPTETLRVGDVAHVASDLAVGPQEKRERGEHALDVIVAFDEIGDFAGHARRGQIEK
jgi:hypothetical protein